MALTGRAAGPVLRAPATLVDRLVALQAAVGDRVGVEVGALLGERAAIAGLSRQGNISCGSATRLLRAADGWCAVSLARPDDVDSIEAWLGVEPGADQWGTLTRELVTVPAIDAADRAQLLGMPVAALGCGPDRTAPALWTPLGEAAPRGLEGALVIDLSSLWAGPLCGHLLQLAGARVVKVESSSRPDGARAGAAAFYDLLHVGQENVALDLSSPTGAAALAALIRRADIVIEGSRPRALQQMGIDARELVATGSVRCWVSITAYGRAEPWGHRVGFGDDAAVAAGLVAYDDEGPVFCADAVADPLAGLSATEAVFVALQRGGRWLIDVSLHASAAAATGPPAPWAPCDGESASLPRARRPRGRAGALGADTDRVLAEILGHRP